MRRGTLAERTGRGPGARTAREASMDGEIGIGKETLDFDLDALREKSRAERDKRLRAEGHLQYFQVEGDYARFAEDDPYVEPGFTRKPLNDEVDVVVIGAGFSGM